MLLKEKIIFHQKKPQKIPFTNRFEWPDLTYRVLYESDAVSVTVSKQQKYLKVYIYQIITIIFHVKFVTVCSKSLSEYKKLWIFRLQQNSDHTSSRCRPWTFITLSIRVYSMSITYFRNSWFRWENSI